MTHTSPILRKEKIRIINFILYRSLSDMLSMNQNPRVKNHRRVSILQQTWKVGNIHIKSMVLCCTSTHIQIGDFFWTYIYIVPFCNESLSKVHSNDPRSTVIDPVNTARLLLVFDWNFSYIILIRIKCLLIQWLCRFAFRTSVYVTFRTFIRLVPV